MPVNVGPMEIVVILIIALVVLGPRRLPEMGRSVGRGMREFRNAVRMDPDDDAPTDPRKTAEREQVGG